MSDKIKVKFIYKQIGAEKNHPEPAEFSVKSPETAEREIKKWLEQHNEEEYLLHGNKAFLWEFVKLVKPKKDPK